MFIKFKTIKYKNFMSYGNSFTNFNFENGIDIVTGTNGSGKSSFAVDPLTFALYGKPYRKVKLSTLINDVNKTSLEVHLEFDIDNIEYKIIRGMKPAIFEIYKSNKLINQEASTKNYQIMLEENILKINEQTFRQLIILGANISSSKPFLELPQGEKEEVFNAIINTSIFGYMLDVIKDRTNTNKTKRVDLEYKIELLSTSYSSEKTNIELMKVSNDEFKNKHSAKLTDLQEEKYTIINEQKKILTILDKSKKVKVAYDNKKELLDKKLEELASSTKLIHFLQAELKQIEKLKLSHSVCIGCDHLKEISTVDLDFESEALWKLEMAQGDNESETEDVKILNKDVEDLVEKIQKIKALVTNKKNNEKRLSQIEKETEDLQSYSFQEVNETNIKKLEYDINKSKSELDSTIQLIMNLDVIKQLVNNKELKGAIIAKQLPILNKLINEYLEKFSSSEFNMIIEPSFKEKIITSRSIEKEFNQLSNGQKFRLTFSLIFAFLKFIEEKNAVQTNILMADEVLDTSLDAQGRDDLLNILHNEFSDKNIIIISHNKEIVQRDEIFNRSITITKENNFSKINGI